MSIPVSSGNVNISAAGNANVLAVTGAGANITGTANVTGNIYAGNVSGGNAVSANYFIGASGITANGNINFTNATNVSLGALGNMHITGGSPSYLLATDGAGNLSWAPPSATSGASGVSGWSGWSGYSEIGRAHV